MPLVTVDLRWWDTHVKGFESLRDGFLHIPMGPGLGIEVDEAAVVAALHRFLDGRTTLCLAANGSPDRTIHRAIASAARSSSGRRNFGSGPARSQRRTGNSIGRSPSCTRS